MLLLESEELLLQSYEAVTIQLPLLRGCLCRYQPTGQVKFCFRVVVRRQPRGSSSPLPESRAVRRVVRGRPHGPGSSDSGTRRRGS